MSRYNNSVKKTADEVIAEWRKKKRRQRIISGVIPPVLHAGGVGHPVDCTGSSGGSLTGGDGMSGSGGAGP